MSEQDLDKTIYRVQFKTGDKDYDIFVRNVYPSDMNGFICLEGFVFLDESRRVIDPRTEKLILEFSQVEVCFIPYYQIIRIDQVKQAGESMIKESKDGSKNLKFTAPIN